MKRKYATLVTGLLCFSFFITSCGQSSAISTSSVNATSISNADIEQDSLKETKENIDFIKSLTELTINRDNKIDMTEEEKQRIDSMMLFGYEGSLEMETTLGESHINHITWMPVHEVSDAEYNVIKDGLDYLYGQASVKTDDNISEYFWHGNEFDVTLEQENDSGISQVSIGFSFGSEMQVEDNNEIDNSTENSSTLRDNSEETLNTLDEIIQKQKTIIEEYKEVFEKSEVPYIVTADGNTILGTELSYDILDKPYGVAEMVSSVYDKDNNLLKTTVNLTIQYHEEKGIDKENSHIILLYNLLSKFENFQSIDDMISMLNSNTSGGNGNYGWTIEPKPLDYTVKVLKFAYKTEQSCNYNEQLNYCEFDSLDEKEQKQQEYNDYVKQKISDAGLGSNFIDAVLWDWDGASYAVNMKNNLGLVIQFRHINTENVDDAVNAVKIYIDAANEIFGACSDISSEMMAQDIVTRDQLKSYSEDSLFRLAQGKEDYQEVSLPTKELLDEYSTPLLNIQYTESAYYDDTDGAYTKIPHNMIIEYYIPIKVQGLLNR